MFTPNEAWCTVEMNYGSESIFDHLLFNNTRGASSLESSVFVHQDYEPSCTCTLCIYNKDTAAPVNLTLRNTTNNTINSALQYPLIGQSTSYTSLTLAPNQELVIPTYQFVGLSSFNGPFNAQLQDAILTDTYVYLITGLNPVITF